MPLTDVVVDVRTDLGKSAGAAGVSGTHTIGSGLVNPAIVVTAYTGAATERRIISAVLDPAGTPFNLANYGFNDEIDHNIYAEIWSAAGCPTGVSKTVTVTAAASCEIAAGVATYQGVNQTTPWHDAVAPTIRSTTGTTVSLTVPSAVHEMVIAAFGENGGSATACSTSGANTIYNANNGAGASGGMGVDAPGAATSVVVTITGITNNNSVVVVGGSLQFDPVGGGGGASILGSHFYRQVARM